MNSSANLDLGRRMGSFLTPKIPGRPFANLPLVTQTPSSRLGAIVFVFFLVVSLAFRDSIMNRSLRDRLRFSAVGALQSAARGFCSFLDWAAMILATIDTTLLRLLEYCMIRVTSASMDLGSTGGLA